MNRKYIFTGLLIVTLLGLLWPSLATHAATITVTTVADVLDAAGACNVVTVASLPGSDDVTSLREAMCAAVNTAGPDTIGFDIPGCGGVCTIRPTSALPALTSSGTTIDGYTQPGASPATASTPAVSGSKSMGPTRGR